MSKKAWVTPIHKKDNPLDLKYILSQTKEIAEIASRNLLREFTPVCESMHLVLNEMHYSDLMNADEGFIIIHEEVI